MSRLSKLTINSGQNHLNNRRLTLREKQIDVQQTMPFFVVPFAANEFKFWSERSAFIEFKANVRNKQFVGEWYRRIGEVYGVDTTDPHLGFEKHWTADRVYRERANSEFCLQWKREGVSHILIDEHLTNPLLTLLDSNARYYIYKIN
jgi:hypothetical protein